MNCSPNRCRSRGAGRGWRTSRRIGGRRPALAPRQKDRPMSATLPTRQQVDQAADLGFDRKPAKPDLLIVVKASIDAFPIELSFSGQIDQLPAIVKRLLHYRTEN